MEPLQKWDPQSSKANETLSQTILSLEGIQLGLPSTFYSLCGSILLYGDRQGQSQTYPKRSNIPAAEVRPLSNVSCVWATWTGRDHVFNRAVKVIWPLWQHLPTASWHIASVMFERQFLSTYNTLILSCTLACHQDSITKKRKKEPLIFDFSLDF